MTTENLQPDLESIESEEKKEIVPIRHIELPSRKLRGIGYTRKSHEQTKKAKKLAKSQRKINRKIANKKFRPTGSKQRK